MASSTLYAPQTTAITTTTTTTLTSTQIVANGAPAPPASDDDAQQAYQSALQVFITAAQAVLADPGADLTRAQEDATRTALDVAIVALQNEQAPTAGTPRLYVCTSADILLPSIAQRFLGDPLRYPEIQALSGIAFLAVQPGMQLLIPAS